MLLSALLAAVMAQAPPPTSAPATQAVAPLLSGPDAVEDDAGKLTLVRRTFDGSVESVGAEPDAVAIGMLDLTEEQRAKFNEVRSARMSAFDEIIRANYGLVLELASLQGETNPGRRLEIVTKTQRAFAPYLDRGSFLREMWPALTDEQRKQVEVMVAEYEYARTEALDREANAQISRRQIALRERLATFGQMLRESIERQVGLERDNFEMLANELGLTPEQRAAAEAIFQPLAIKRFQNIQVTPAERSAAFAEFNKVLTAGQKQKAFGIMLRQYQSTHNTTSPPDTGTTRPETADEPGMD